MIVIHTEQEKGFWTGDEHNRFLQTFLNSESYPEVHGLSVGMVIVPPNTEGGMHEHKEAQEIWYVLEGQGQMQVGEEICDIASGDLVYGPEKVKHQIINNGSEGDLKALLILCPGGDEKNVLEALAQGKGVLYQRERD